MNAVEQALQDLQSTKKAYQPMLEPSAPPQGTSGGPVAQEVPPPTDPAAQPPVGIPPPAAPAGAAVDPEMIMELMSALEQVGAAMQALGERVNGLEQEHKRIAHEFAKSQGEQAMLVKILKEYAPMGPEVGGAAPTAPAGTGIPQEQIMAGGA